MDNVYMFTNFWKNDKGTDFEVTPCKDEDSAYNLFCRKVKEAQKIDVQNHGYEVMYDGSSSFRAQDPNSDNFVELRYYKAKLFDNDRYLEEMAEFAGCPDVETYLEVFGDEN